MSLFTHAIYSTCRVPIPPLRSLPPVSYIMVDDEEASEEHEGVAD
jgi:hypothetical protein